MTVNDLLTRTLKDLNVLDATATLGADDAQFALDALNDWVDWLKAQSLIVYTLSRVTWTITANVTTYSVGTGSTVNIARPNSANELQHTGYIDTSVTPNLEVKLGPPLTEDAYAAIPQKALTGTYPVQWYYNPTTPTGTLIPYPIPTSTSLQGVIYAPNPVAEFSAQSDTVVLPVGYRLFFRTTLAKFLAAAYQVQLPPSLAELARETETSLKHKNTRMVDLAVDRAWTSRGCGYDINSDRSS